MNATDPRVRELTALGLVGRAVTGAGASKRDGCCPLCGAADYAYVGRIKVCGTCGFNAIGERMLRETRRLAQRTPEHLTTPTYLNALFYWRRVHAPRLGSAAAGSAPALPSTPPPRSR